MHVRIQRVGSPKDDTAQSTLAGCLALMPLHVAQHAPAYDELLAAPLPLAPEVASPCVRGLVLAQVGLGEEAPGAEQTAVQPRPGGRRGASRTLLPQDDQRECCLGGGVLVL